MGRREHVPLMGYEQPRREGPCMKEDLRMRTTNEKKKKENVTEGWGEECEGARNSFYMAARKRGNR